jgi:hypothetical protein
MFGHGALVARVALTPTLSQRERVGVRVVLSKGKLNIIALR